MVDFVRRILQIVDLHQQVRNLSTMRHSVEGLGDYMTAGNEILSHLSIGWGTPVIL